MFDVFRKYQKTMLAFLAIFAMFAFILSGAIDSFSQRQMGGDPVVATAWGKPINLSEVSEVDYERSKLNEFLARAAAHAKLDRAPFQFRRNTKDEIVAGIVLARRAASLGIRVTDQEIVDWLNRQTDDKLSPDDFKGILSGEINPGNETGETRPLGLSEFTLFAALSRELAIQRLMTVMLPPESTVLDAPIEVWNRESPKLTQVSLEFVEVPTAKFVDPAAQPTEAQLQETYNKYATVEPNAKEGQPGFLLPRRVSIEYLEAKVDSLAASQEVTDEEIAQYYEANKQEFTEVPKPALDSSVPTPPPPPTEGAPAPEPKPESNEASAPDAAKEPAAPAPTEPSAPPPPSEPAPATPAPPAEGKQSLRLRWPSLPGLVARWMISPWTAFQEPAPAAASAPSGSAPADVASPSAQTPADVASPSAQAPADVAAPSAQALADVAAPSAPAPAAPGTASVESAPPPPRQKSLDEVKEEIRTLLKKQKAERALKAKMQGVIDSKLNPYRMETYEPARRKFQASQPKDSPIDWQKFAPPALGEIEKLASEQGYELKKAGPIGVAELDSLGPLSTAVRVDRRAGTGVPESLRQLAFKPQMGDDLYAARMMYDAASGTCYVYWKVKDEAPKPQPMEEVKDKLVEIWRKESAQPKAKEIAQGIIDKAKASEGKLEAGIPPESGYTAQKTESFPRVRVLASGVTPGLEQSLEVKIANIKGAGESFLDEVFKLKQGEFAVIPDEKNENYYAVKVATRSEPDLSSFAQKYRNDQVLRRQYAQFLGGQTQSIIFQQILQEAKVDPPLFQPAESEIESAN